VIIRDSISSDINISREEKWVIFTWKLIKCKYGAHTLKGDTAVSGSGTIVAAR
jgi:hypothetical protein